MELNDLVTVAHVEKLVFKVVGCVSRILQSCYQRPPVVKFLQPRGSTFMLIEFYVVDLSSVSMGGSQKHSVI